MFKCLWTLVCSAVVAQAAWSATPDAPMPSLRADQVAFLALFKELVETNTTLSAGSCTLAAERMAVHLKAAGFADTDITVFSPPEHPKEGGLVAAEFALNEGGGGLLDEHGKMLEQDLVVAEKTARNYRLATVNPGGHSSIPIRDNAIYELADALIRVRESAFPMKVTPINQAYFAKVGAVRGDELGRAMLALAQNPDDTVALAKVSKDRLYNALLHTTCVATLLDGGHATNALPQRAGANVNCRIFPGETAESTRAALEAATADPRVTVTLIPRDKPLASSAPLDPRIVGPAEKVAEYFPGVPLIPVMATGSSDGPYLAAIGIPVYGVPGVWADPDFNGVHGLNEYISARSLFAGRDLMTDLVKIYAN
jgi:acetylornithine deacetylase/succinyl-diaminopimelate desuccinylase-like protein